MAISPSPTTHVTVDLLAWQESGALELSPKFQRRPVWKQASKSYFIDSLLRGYPVPPIHIRLGISHAGTAVREIVDGQQRLRAVFDFISGRYRLSKSLEAPWAGKSFAELTTTEANQLRMYKFHAFQYDGIDDATVLEIFARINTYSVALTKQELRNGQYFGAFKNTMYDLAREHLTFWRDTRMFSETGIARMSEVELVSELTVLLLDGPQDKKNSLDSYYKTLDDTWAEQPERWTYRGRSIPSHPLSRSELVDRFEQTIADVRQVVGSDLSDSEFRRIPLFYSLFAVLAHHRYAMANIDRISPMRSLDANEVIALRSALEELSQIVSEKATSEDVPGWKRDYLVASSRQTDNIGPRLARIETLWDRAELGGK